MRSSSSIILIALAVADTANLWVALPDPFVTELYDIHLAGTPFSCKFYTFLLFLAEAISIWLIIVFTIFRFIGVCYPHKANIYCTKWRAYLSVALVIFFSLVLASEPLFTRQTIPGGYGMECYAKDKHRHFYEKYYDLLQLFLSTIVPFTIIISLNSVIIFTIIRAKKTRQLMQAESTSSDSQSLTAMLISISLLFVISRLPWRVTNMIEARTDFDNYSQEYRLGYWLLETATKLLLYVNNVANFFCYCVAGKRFRSELVSMVTCDSRSKVKKKQSRSMNTLSNVLQSERGSPNQHSATHM